MTIPKDKLKEIAALREPSDVSKLAAVTGVSKSYMFLILKNGKCAGKVASSILKFYEARKAERKFLNELLQDND